MFAQLMQVELNLFEINYSLRVMYRYTIVIDKLIFHSNNIHVTLILEY